MEGSDTFSLEKFANARQQFSRNDVLEPIGLPLLELRIAQYRYNTSWKLLFSVPDDVVPDAKVKEYKTKFTNMIGLAAMKQQQV
jgi:hypothetical protein